MAKQKKGKKVQMLSPENYIRRKARTLPICECRVSIEWDETHLAHVIVARSHTNGNITMGVFLVDLNCLGIKDTTYGFNLSQSDYREMLSDISDDVELEQIEYALAHNIVFAGLEFAEQFGFEPHKDFTSVSQYVLEEDNDDIELIDIECGENGMPVYVQGPFDNDVRVKQIIATLDRTAGTGNYLTILKSEDEDGYYDDLELGNDVVDEFSTWTETEKLKEFLRLLDKEPEDSDENRMQIDALLYSIVSAYVDYDEYDRLYDGFVDNLLEMEIDEAHTYEQLGLKHDDEDQRQELQNTFNEINDLIFSKPKAARKKIKEIMNKYPDNPALHYLNIALLQYNKEELLYLELLEMYYQQNPEYPLLKMMWLTDNLMLEENFDEANLFVEGPKVFFGKRKNWHVLERTQYFITLIAIACSKLNLTLMEVMEDFLIENEYLIGRQEEMLSQISTAKIFFVILLIKERGLVGEEEEQKGDG